MWHLLLRYFQLRRSRTDRSASTAEIDEKQLYDVVLSLVNRLPVWQLSTDICLSKRYFCVACPGFSRGRGDGGYVGFHGGFSSGRGVVRGYSSDGLSGSIRSSLSSAAAAVVFATVNSLVLEMATQSAEDIHAVAERIVTTTPIAVLTLQPTHSSACSFIKSCSASSDDNKNKRARDLPLLPTDGEHDLHRYDDEEDYERPETAYIATADDTLDDPNLYPFDV
jgi:hypothetical protein